MTREEIEHGLKIIDNDDGIMISSSELSELSDDEKENIVIAYRSHDVDRLYDIIDNRQKLDILIKVADYLERPYEELTQLPDDKIDQLCGIYLFSTSSNVECKDELNRIISE